MQFVAAAVAAREARAYRKVVNVNVKLRTQNKQIKKQYKANSC